MLSSTKEADGYPDLASSLKSSWPPLKILIHLKGAVFINALFPQIALNIWWFSWEFHTKFDTDLLFQLFINNHCRQEQTNSTSSCIHNWSDDYCCSSCLPASREASKHGLTSSQAHPTSSIHGFIRHTKYILPFKCVFLYANKQILLC